MATVTAEVPCLPCVERAISRLLVHAGRPRHSSQHLPGHRGTLVSSYGFAGRSMVEAAEGSVAMMWWYGGGPGWAGWTLMTLMMLAFWALLVFGGVAVYRLLRDGNERSGDERSDPQRLLDERFARGEIDADEYRQRRELLRSGR